MNGDCVLEYCPMQSQVICYLLHIAAVVGFRYSGSSGRDVGEMFGLRFSLHRLIFFISLPWNQHNNRSYQEMRGILSPFESIASCALQQSILHTNTHTGPLMLKPEATDIPHILQHPLTAKLLNSTLSLFTYSPSKIVCKIAIRVS